jgi:regulator of sigma E protease
MTILITIFYFIITIGILVLVHELGHFLAAKFFRMRVDTFSIGFPPRAFGKKIGDTDYCFSWIPIGGYVKIAGMIDESMDTDFINQEPQPWEFRSKPKWQRAIVLSAGVLMNLFLAVFIFWGLIYYEGRTIRPITEIGYVTPNSPAAKAGLHAGDKILSINNQSMQHWDEIESSLYTESISHDLALNIQRYNETLIINIPRVNIPDPTDERFGILPAGLVPVVETVDHGKPAEKIGLQPNDTIVAINGLPMFYGILQETIRANAGKEVLLTWVRGNHQMSSKITPNAEGFIGIKLDVVYRGPQIHEQYSFLEALPIGIKELKLTSVLFLSNIYQIAVGKASLSKSVGGPVKIAQMAKRSAENGIAEFFGFIGLLSISLALLNILPFPALDGGHLVFLGYEALFRREVPVKVKIVVQQAGFFLLLVFMAFVLYNDVINY